MLAIQEFLGSGKTLEDLEKLYGIKAKRHKKYNNLVLLKYNQIESPFAERIVQECRGIILDENDSWKVVSRAFDKFFNHGEHLAAQIDWSRASVQEKLDGSLISMYWYDNRWNVATSGSPDASGDVFDCGFTFEELFWNTFTELGYKLPPEEYKHVTFVFELMTKFNRVVVVHKEPRIVLIGMRDNSGLELNIYDNSVDTDSLNYQKVRVFLFTNSIEDIVASFSAIDPTNQEGYVVLDDDFNRVKVKHPGYVQLHRFKDGMSPKNLLDIIRIGETSELLVHFPEWAAMHKKMKARYDFLLELITQTFVAFQHLTPKKEFALAVKHTSFSGILFGLYDKKISSVKQGLKDLDIDKLYKIILDLEFIDV